MPRNNNAYHKYVTNMAKNSYRKHKLTDVIKKSNNTYRDNYDKIDWGKKDEQETARNENEQEG